MTTTTSISPYAFLGLRRVGAMQRTPTDRIIAAVCDEFGVTHKKMSARSRKTEVRLPRQVAMYLLAIYTRHTLVHIGQLFGGRDHTTVIHARELIRDYLSVDEQLHARVQRIKLYAHIF